MCVSRSRRCEGKACYSSPRTLGGAPLFRSPCLLCAGSAGLEMEAHLKISCFFEFFSKCQSCTVTACHCCECTTALTGVVLVGDTHTLTQLTDEEGAQRGLLVVILNIYIDDVNRLQSLLLSWIQIWRTAKVGETVETQANCGHRSRFFFLQFLIYHSQPHLIRETSPSTTWS